MTDAGAVRIVVALTTCDSEGYLEQQLESIGSQTRSPDALVVGDDRSTDCTRVILDDFARRAPFPVVVIAHGERLGPLGNTAAILTRAGGMADVIALADHDDVWAPDKLSAVDEVFRANAPPAVWFSDADLIDANGELLSQQLFDMVHLGAGDRELLRNGGGLRRLIHGETITNPTMAVRADLASLCLPFPDDRVLGRLCFQQDGWMAVLGRVLGDIQVDDRAFIAYRRHERSMSHQEALLPASESAGSTRRADLEREQRRARLVADRVRERDAAWDPHRREEIIALDRFLSARTDRTGPFTRLHGIGRELRAGSYGRFARGARTAVYDLADSFRAIS